MLHLTTQPRPSFVAAWALAAMFASGNPAAAQISVQPAIVELSSTQENASTVIRVRNHGSTPADIRLRVADFEQRANGSHRFSPRGTHAQSCDDALRVLPARARIAPGASSLVRIALTTTGGEGCQAVVFVETGGDKPGIRVSGRVGVKVYGVPPSPVAAMEITDLVADARGDSLHVSLTVANRGSAPLRPKGRLELRSVMGDLADEASIDPFSLHPGGIRRLERRVPAPASGDYLVLPLIDFGGDYIEAARTNLRIP